MSSAVECRPFCLRANEIRYQYVYHRQKLGIYIYIRLSVGGGGCHYDDSTAPQVVVTTTRCRKRPHSRHTDSPPQQCAIHRNNINHSKAVHIWHEHVGPGHDLIKDLNSCSECAVFMFMGSMFRTCAP